MGCTNAPLVLMIFMSIICMVYTSYTISTDETALLSFKNGITSDPNDVLTHNWTRGTPICHWHGVTCSAKHTRVTSLKLISMGLGGTIAKHVGNLSFLVHLDIADNSFHGDIPQEIGHLRRLKYLSLQYNKLSGSIPPSFGFLSRLQLLDLSDNHLVGDIPSSIFNISFLMIVDFGNNLLQGTLPTDICRNLPRLRDLYASENQLGGQLPFLGQCRQLVDVSLSINEFIGGVPKEIWNLSTLQYISLGWNNLTGGFPKEVGNASALQHIIFPQNDLTGILPPSLGNLSNLQVIDLYHNNFYGHIPTQLGHLSNLQKLYFNFNNFSGEIPLPIFNFSNLQILSLVGNHLSGTIPSEMAINLPNIRTMTLAINHFTGQIPPSISNASKLTNFSLGSNFFYGYIPETLGNLPLLERIILQSNQFTVAPTKPELGFLHALVNNPSLRTLQIGYNPLNGIFPKSLASSNISSLEKLHASGCGIKGTISTDIGNFTKLYWLSLAENDLTGRIPDNIGRLRALQRLRLFDNRIGGGIPSGMCNMEELYELGLSKNVISGEFPSCLGNISSLRELYADSNALTSPLPSTFWSNKGLLVVDLSSNFLNGSIGQDIGGITGLRHLNLSGNNFSGQIPTSIGRLQVLVNLSLSMNLLNGSLPQELGELSSLEYLDLSHNHISGAIPKTMEKLRYLKFLNLSFNKLSGEIPNEGPFQTCSDESFVGNAALCGASRFHVLACKHVGERSGRSQLNFLKHILPLFCALSLVFVIGLVIWIVKFRNEGEKGDVETNDLEQTRRFSYLEILEGTNNFNETNLVGMGSCGVVYKGLFPDGMAAAIKIFNLETPGALKSFDVECQVLRSIRHRNLVKVISSCSNHDFRAIIFEYMPNGSLDHWLHYRDSRLDMIQRLGIMIDVASALEYLHHHCSFPMVHCDLKPSNILFDEDMVARVADFGIVKLIAGEKPSVLTRTLGTMGYMAPEYGLQGLVSTMVDIYSFGILLMETFTGKKPTDRNFTDDLTIKKWVGESLQLQTAVMKIIDPKLLALMGDDQEVDTERACFSSLMKIALACTDDLPENRINMVTVLARLEKIKSKFVR